MYDIGDNKEDARRKWKGCVMAYTRSFGETLPYLIEDVFVHSKERRYTLLGFLYEKDGRFNQKEISSLDPKLNTFLPPSQYFEINKCLFYLSKTGERQYKKGYGRGLYNLQYLSSNIIDALYALEFSTEQINTILQKPGYTNIASVSVNSTSTFLALIENKPKSLDIAINKILNLQYLGAAISNELAISYSPANLNLWVEYNRTPIVRFNRKNPTQLTLEPEVYPFKELLQEVGFTVG